MAIGEVAAYANVSAAALANAPVASDASQNQSVDQDDNKLKQALKKIAEKAEVKTKTEKVETNRSQGVIESKADALFKGLAEGKAGAIGQKALETFKDAGLAPQTNAQSRETFGGATQKNPQAGFNAASSFQRSSSLPGADKALGSTPVASECLVVTTQAATQGDKQLKEVEKVVGEFVQAFGNDDSSPTVKKKVFDKTVKNPGSETTKAAMEWGKSKQMKLQNGSAQEAMANLLQKADPKEPGKFKEVMKGLEKFAEDPKLLSPKMNSADMKSNFSNLSKAVMGSPKLAVSLEAQEKLLSTSKFHNINANCRAKIQQAVGKAPQQADDVAKAMGQLRESRLPKFAAKLSQLGTDPETMKKIVSDCKTREIAYPAIEPFDPNDPNPGKRSIAFKAKWNRVAQQIDKHNGGIAKSLNKCKCMKDLNDLPVPRGFGPIIGDARNPQELAEKTGCTLEEASYIFELSGRCEDTKTNDLQLSKNLSTKRRALRGKPDTRASLKDKRTSVAGLPAKTTITLSEEDQGQSTAELRKLLNASTTKTQPIDGEEGANATSTTEPEAPPSKEEIAARNSQTFKPTGAKLNVGGKGMKGWGNNMVVVGMDAEVQKKKLAKLREDKATALKLNPTRLSKGPSIGRAGDFTPLSEVVAKKTPWRDLNPAEKAAMRNLQMTPNILESWYAGKNRTYSSLQAKSWDDLTEIQQKSAQLLGLESANWNALAAVLSTNVKAQGELRKAKTVHNVVEVRGKANA